MNVWDIVIGALVAAAVIGAVLSAIKRKKSGSSCCGDCSKCNKR